MDINFDFNSDFNLDYNLDFNNDDNKNIDRLLDFLTDDYLFKGKRGVVVVCIGTDRVLGDCLGAYIGELLKISFAPCFVYGTLSKPITALNCNYICSQIKINHPNCSIIAIDASIGINVGSLKIEHKSIIPAQSTNKSLNPVGDISIKATTCNSSAYSLEFLTVSLNLVHSLSKKIVNILLNALTQYNHKFFSPCSI